MESEEPLKDSNPFKPGTPEAAAWDRLAPEPFPRHIAVIMDGNGRWAQSRGKLRISGHRAGVSATKEIVKACAKMGLEYLTLYAFSMDNWKRPEAETAVLMDLLRQYVRKELDYMNRNNVRLRVIGRWRELPGEVVADVSRALEETRANTGLQVVVALNYTGRGEMLDAIREIVAQHRDGNDAEITESDIQRRLYAPDIPEPDLLIRTSGEQRISNFLLWQLAYTELLITDTFWPDFTPAELIDAIRDYQLRERRFGGLTESGQETDGKRKAKKESIRS